jgi:tetratricopeptide (TPR) repeat protein
MGHRFVWMENRFMARPLAKSPFVLLALGLWILACPASLAEDDDPNALNQQVTKLFEQGKYQEAIPIAERAVEVAKHSRGPEHPETADALNNLGFLFQKIGDYAQAESLLQEALRIRQKVLGPEHPDTASSLNSLAELYQDVGEYAKAEPLLQQALRICQKVLGSEHPDTVENLNNLASLYQHMGEYVKAEPLYQETLRIRQKVLGPQHLDTAESLNNLASLYQHMGEYVKAEPLYQEALRVCQKVLGSEHPDTAQGLTNLATLYLNMGEYAKAEPLLQEALRIRRKVLGPEDHYTATSLNNLALLFRRTGEYSKAEPLYREALRIDQKVLGPEHPDTARSLNNLADLSLAMGEYAKAEPLLQEALRIFQKTLGPEHPDTVVSLNNLAEVYQVMGEYAKAEPLLQEVLRTRQKVLGPEHRSTATSINNLALLLAKADDGSSDPAPESIARGERGEIEDWSFASLEGTQKERDELMKKFVGWGWKPSDFTAKEATKEALLKIHAPYILHLATHGFFAKEDPTAIQAEPTAMMNARQGVTKSKFFKNPMHRSGLALAGAQTTIEAWKQDEVPSVENDGILTAEDVSTLDLQGTWLVTLSACDTGSGLARAGEGVMGLRRGFIQAGAQNLLMTLWPISDEVTVEIMSDFYDAAHNTGNAPEALAEVQREWLVQLRDGKGPKFDTVKDAIKGRGGLAKAVNLAGPFIISSQGKP